METTEPYITERELKAQAKTQSKAKIDACVARVKARMTETRVKKTVLIFTDGACSGNPGPGGWGVVIQKDGKTRELSGGDPQTTNNKMELTAAIRALKSLRTRSTVIITVDSKYVKEGLTEWLPKWKQNGWKTSNRKPVKNDDLWRELDSLCQNHEVSWAWVKGHSGHEQNERCDELARMAVEAIKEEKGNE